MSQVQVVRTGAGAPRRSSKLRWWIGCFAVLSLLLAPQPGRAGSEAADPVGGVDPLESLLESSQLWQDLGDTSKSWNEVLDQVYSFSYEIPYAPGQALFVTEHLTLRSVLRRPARAVVFFPGPSFRGSFWSIPVDGYNLTEMAARRGFFAFTFDYVGVGESYLPPDGSQATSAANVAPARKLIDFVRHWRGVDRVDLAGEGFGLPIAATLAAEPERVRSVVLSTPSYRDLSPAVLAFFSPLFEAFLRGQPDGYWTPNTYPQTLLFSPDDELRSWVLETQPGVYPTGQALQFWDVGLPYFDPTVAAAPALVIKGELDAFPAPGDVESLVDEWAGGAQLVVILGAHHVPRIEAEEIAAQYVDALFAFIDP